MAGSSSGSGLIPGNLRQMMLPFVLKPQSSVCASEQGSSSTTPSSAVFSFRSKDIGSDGNGKLNIFPTDYGMYNNDIGLKQLVSYFLKKDGSIPTLENIINNVPAIQIREYTQDTKLEMVWDLVSNLLKGISKGTEVANGDNDLKDPKKSMVYNKAYATYMAQRIGDTFQDKGFWNELGKKISDFFGSSTVYPSSSIDKNMLVVKLVHAFYYRMVGSTSTNFYTLPYTTNDYLVSDGSQGWGEAGKFGFGGTSSNSPVGRLLNFIGGNVKIVTTPIWKPEFNSNGTSITMKFDLFNDTYEHAMNNFLFVNNIVPSNMFLQYGIFQLPPSVYDIKIEGGRRLYMCSGKFTCRNKGVVRQPTEDFVKELVAKHLNSGVQINLSPDDIINNNMVKIPDIYEMELTFTSVLPDNFNNYIFQFGMNNNIAVKGIPLGTPAFWADGGFKSELEEKLKQMHNDADAEGKAANEKAAAEAKAAAEKAKAAESAS